MLRQDVLNKIAQQLLIDIDNYCNKKWENGFRTHLGASEIGTDCQRKLWYRFRWIVKPEFEPRMKRLLNRGHMEEERILDYLRGIGCVVKPFDDSYRLLIDLTDNSRYFCVHCNDPVFDELDSMGVIDVSNDFLHIKKANEQGVKYPAQYSCSAVEGHFGGSCDGRGYLPKHYGIEEEILFEFKTANEKSFNGLLKDGMQKHQPLHYAQCCAYGYLMKLNYVCYVSACKNDDRLYLEILPLNHKTGEMRVMTADRVIKSREPLPRLFENPTYYICKRCECFSVCHGDGKPEKNCRSCKFAEPAKEKQWICNKHNCVIPDEQMTEEWECWESII